MSQIKNQYHHSNSSKSQEMTTANETKSKPKAILWTDTEVGGPYLLKSPLLAIGTALIVHDGKKWAFIEKKRWCLNIDKDCEMDRDTYDRFWAKNIDIFRTIRCEAKDTKEQTVFFISYLDSLDEKYDVLRGSDWLGDQAKLSVWVEKYCKRAPTWFSDEKRNSECKKGRQENWPIKDSIDLQSLLMERLPTFDRHDFSIAKAIETLHLDVGKAKHTHLPDDDAELMAMVYIALTQ
jgi:hypothetical protein